MQLHCGHLLVLIPVAILGNYLNCPGAQNLAVESLKKAVVKIFEDFYSRTPVVNFVRSIEDVKIDLMVDEIIEKVMKVCDESMSF